MTHPHLKRRFMVLGAAALALSACAPRSKFRRYRGPRVTRILVDKGARKMHLFNGRRVLETYDIELGFSPRGHKVKEGDGRTPEGRYIIDRRNPNSSFHLSLGINYPRPQDIARARRLGVDPGGEIFIHGQRRPWDPKGPDWTAGCIAVTNREMEKIYAMVKNGTVVDIIP